MKDGRKYVRRQASDYLLVTNRITGQILGRVVNLSPTGIMVMSATALVVGQTYQLSIKLPVKVSEAEYLSVTTVCRWSTFEKRSDLWESGLEIGEISIDDRKVLQQVVLLLMEHNGTLGDACDIKFGNGSERVELIPMRRYRR